MKQIRQNIYEITFAELGNPPEKGDYDVQGLGTVMLDVADMRYISEMQTAGYEPRFFISKSAPLGNRYIVVSRQQKA